MSLILCLPLFVLISVYACFWFCACVTCSNFEVFWSCVWFWFCDACFIFCACFAMLWFSGACFNHEFDLHVLIFQMHVFDNVLALHNGFHVCCLMVCSRQYAWVLTLFYSVFVMTLEHGIGCDIHFKSKFSYHLFNSTW